MDWKLQDYQKGVSNIFIPTGLFKVCKLNICTLHAEKFKNCFENNIYIFRKQDYFFIHLA